MRKPILDQAAHILSLVSQKNADYRRVQDLIDRGILADLLGAKTLPDRAELQKLLGLNGVSVPAFRYDKRTDGWELLEGADEPMPEGNVVPPLEIVSFLREGEDRIGGEELVRRDREEFLCDRGQRFVEWLLDRQDQIPEEFRKYYLVFTKTVWRDSRGGRRVASLSWYGRRWCLFFGWLDGDFRGGDRLVRPREGA